MTRFTTVPSPRGAQPGRARQEPRRALSRRGFLAAVASTAAAAVLPACAAGTGGTGRLRVAFATAGGQASLAPHPAPLFVDQARAKAAFDAVAADDDGT